MSALATKGQHQQPPPQPAAAAKFKKKSFSHQTAPPSAVPRPSNSFATATQPTHQKRFGRKRFSNRGPAPSMGPRPPKPHSGAPQYSMAPGFGKTRPQYRGTAPAIGIGPRPYSFTAAPRPWLKPRFHQMPFPHIPAPQVFPHIPAPQLVPHIPAPQLVPHIPAPQVLPHIPAPPLVPHIPTPQVFPQPPMPFVSVPPLMHYPNFENMTFPPPPPPPLPAQLSESMTMDTISDHLLQLRRAQEQMIIIVPNAARVPLSSAPSQRIKEETSQPLQIKKETPFSAIPGPSPSVKPLVGTKFIVKIDEEYPSRQASDRTPGPSYFAQRFDAKIKKDSPSREVSDSSPPIQGPSRFAQLDTKIKKESP